MRPWPIQNELLEQCIIIQQVLTAFWVTASKHYMCLQEHFYFSVYVCTCVSSGLLLGMIPQHEPARIYFLWA